LHDSINTSNSHKVMPQVSKIEVACTI